MWKPGPFPLQHLSTIPKYWKGRVQISILHFFHLLTKAPSASMKSEKQHNAGIRTGQTHRAVSGAFQNPQPERNFIFPGSRNTKGLTFLPQPERLPLSGTTWIRSADNGPSIATFFDYSTALLTERRHRHGFIYINKCHKTHIDKLQRQKESLTIQVLSSVLAGTLIINEQNTKRSAVSRLWWTGRPGRTLLQMSAAITPFKIKQVNKGFWPAQNMACRKFLLFCRHWILTPSS